MWCVHTLEQKYAVKTSGKIKFIVIINIILSAKYCYVMSVTN